MRSIYRILVLLIAAILAAPAFGLSDEEIFRDFPFNQVSPGARAAGLGGAFISLADDSTAAQANPAGLMNLRRPELFVELRSRGYDSSQVGVAGPIDGDFFQGQIEVGASSTPETSFGPTFISYVVPFERVSFGFSRLESLNIETRTRNGFRLTGQEAIVDFDPNTGEPIITGFQPVDLNLTAEADVDALIEQYNVAMAFNLHRTFSVGLTAVYGRADINGRVDNLFVDAAGPLFQNPTLDYATRINDSDSDVAYNVGVLWRPGRGVVSIGGVYRKGLQYSLRERIEDQGVRADQAQRLFGRTFENRINTPDTYGLGISFRPSEPWTILIDVVHIEYSDLMEGYVSGLNRVIFPEPGEFVVDDGDEVHFGIERIFLAGKTAIAARLGYWSDPDHRIRAADNTDLVGAFPAGQRWEHVTAGLGVTLEQGIQIDVAVDVSDVNTSYIFSSIYRF
ncbi:hypothetical protein ABI59_13535 [Acidobacteria bacterium Mor1]|nr:hypothetical protein ABI59_13535 [Acidobacteria bacterium Mor1]